MANIWANRLFGDGNGEGASLFAQERSAFAELASRVDKLKISLSKMAAVRPSEPISEAYRELTKLDTEIRAVVRQTELELGEDPAALPENITPTAFK